MLDKWTLTRHRLQAEMSRPGSLVIDRIAHRVTRRGHPVSLTPKEYELLSFLADNPGRAFSREQILSEVWRSDPRYFDVGTVTVHMRRLRTKVEADPDRPQLLITVRGNGYRFDPPKAPTLVRALAPTGEKVSRQAHFLDLIKTGDIDSAVRVALAQLQETGSFDQVSDDLLVPALHEVGVLWVDGTWTVADGNAATYAIESVLSSMARSIDRSVDRPSGAYSSDFGQGRIAVSSAECDAHMLPARLIGEDLRARGWAVRFIEGSVPVVDLTRYLRHQPPDALLISCTTALGVPGLARATAAAGLLGIPVIAGGNGIKGPDDARRLGANGWAISSSSAADLLNSWRTSPAPPLQVTSAPDGIDLDSGADELGIAALVEVISYLPVLDTANGRRNAREQLTRLIRTLSAAVILDDQSIIVEYLGWWHTAVALQRPHGELRAITAITVTTLLARGHAAAANMLAVADSQLTA